jgi:ATP-dependent Clp protease adaptor protein ClpS
MTLLQFSLAVIGAIAVDHYLKRHHAVPRQDDEPAPTRPEAELSPGVRTAYYAGFEEATNRGHAVMTADHFLLFALTDDDVRRAITAQGADLGALHEASRRSLDALPRCAESTTVEARLAPDLNNALYEDGDDLLRLASRLLAPRGITLDRGAPPASPYRRGSQSVVRLMNDDVTTQEFVIRVLRETFEFDEWRAKYVMGCIHYAGSAVVATLPPADARAKADVVVQRARAEGFPLVVEVEAAEI